MTAATEPEAFTAIDREQLREWLRRDGFLRADDGVRLTAPDGSRRAWMFYSWALTATGPGARLAARALLDQLAGLEGTQLAFFGLTAAPLVSACTVLDARYTTLAVRPEPKGHGTRRQVDGRPRRGPVVVVDDSLSSGRSFLTAAAILEREGFQVEGVVALVEFPGRGGRERAEGLGYRVRTVFDIWTDLEAPGPPPPPPDWGVVPHWAGDRLPDDLHPAEAARRALARLAIDGTTPLPPARVGGDIDGRGGVFVSVRRRGDDRRLARGGWWHFEPDVADPCRDLLLATTATARRLGRALTPALLDEVKIAVTFLGPLEATDAADLDFDRYGIVVRSRAWTTKLGGALPNTESFTSTLEQYRHARWTNAGIDELEPHDLFRHTVAKYIEPGTRWPPYGTDAATTDGWMGDDAIGARLAARAREVLLGSVPTGTRLAEDLVPVAVDGVAVALYRERAPRGPVGHGMARGGSLDALVVAAAQVARKSAPDDVDLAAVGVCISLHHDREIVGAVEVPHTMRRGRDAVEAREGDRHGLVTEYAVSHHDWSAAQVGEALRRMTGTERPVWATYQAATWLDRPGEDVRRLAHGYPVRRGRLGRDDVVALVDHLRARADERGWPAYGYEPRTGRAVRTGTAARCLHGLRVLHDVGVRCDRPDWRADAARGVSSAIDHLDRTNGSLHVPGHTGSGMASACLLAAIAPETTGDDPGWADALTGHLASWVRPNGAIRPPGVTPTRSDPDFLPGAVVLGLARARASSRPVDLDVATVLRFHRQRFRCLHPWGLAAWHAQAWAAWHRTGAADAGVVDFVYELADWMVAHQLRRDGSFLVDLGARVPGVLTGFVAEGVGAAWRLAEDLGDVARARRYVASWEAAMSFLDGLLVRREDTFWMADPMAALGGVRAAAAGAELRIDYTSHTLSALLHGV